MPPIQFYFELASPYSYLASLQIEQLGASANRSVDWLPVDIEVVWAAQGVLEAYAAIRRLKRSYIARDSQRCAAALGTVFAKPATAARDTAFAKLAYWGIHSSDPALAKIVIQAVWHRHFREGAPIATAEDLAAACVDTGLGAAAINLAAQSPAAREAQGAANAQAVRWGCFGIPWLVVDGESYFGHDRLPHVAARLHAKAAA